MFQPSRVSIYAVGAAVMISLFDMAAFAQGRRGGGDESRRRDGDGGSDSGGERGDRSFAERFRERFGDRFGGGGGFGGGFSGGGFGGGFGGAMPWGGGGQDRSDGDEGESDEPKEKPRVTVDLPEGYLAGDLDHDGQIGYYEWRLWQRTGAAQFARWDTNHDGFLTPKELVGVAPPSGSTGTPAAFAAAGPQTGPAASPFASVKTTRTPTGSNTAKPLTGGPIKLDADDPIVLKARNYFSLMDENKDGMISAEELEKSNRVRLMFKNAGVDLAQPMDSDQFVETYVRVSAS
jgi:hypothetical protein